MIKTPPTELRYTAISHSLPFVHTILMGIGRENGSTIDWEKTEGFRHGFPLSPAIPTAPSL